MKKKLKPLGLFVLVIIALPVVIITFIKSNENHKEIRSKNTLDQKRAQHQQFLNSSPYTETLKMSKSERKSKGLPPNRYFEQMWELSINPQTGNTTPENLYEVQQQLKAAFAKKAPGDDPNNPWIERGPNNVGGRTRVLLFDPNDPNARRVFAGGVSGGLWVNENITSQNATWQRVENVPGNLAVTSLTIDPNNSDIWYLGTGEQYSVGVVGNGVYKSTNGGRSWAALTVPPANDGDVIFTNGDMFISGIFYINDMVAWNNPAQNRTELFIGVGAKFYALSSNPRAWLGQQNAGLYHSIDAGNTWNRIEADMFKFEFSNREYFNIPNDFEVASDNTLWMSTIGMRSLGNIGGRIYSTTNGTAWTEAAASPLRDSDRVEIEVSSTNPNKLYALTEGVARDADQNVLEPVHIFSTSDGFNTVAELALPNDQDPGIPDNDFTRGQAFYDLMIEADPLNDAILYVGGIDLFRSTNSGNSWSQISKWFGGGPFASLPASVVHADQHAMAFRPGNSNNAIFGNDGGVYFCSSLSTSPTRDVISAKNNNYNVTQFVKAAIGPDGRGDTQGIFSAGSQDNGTQGFRNASAGINSSEEVSDGDGFYTFIDKDGEYMISTFIRNRDITRFELPWNGVSEQRGEGIVLLDDGTSGDFVNQMGYDSDANLLLTNGTDESGSKIKTIDVDLNLNATIENALLTAKPTALTPSPSEDDTWLIGTADSKLLKLTSVGLGTANWSEIPGPFVGSVSSIREGASANEIMLTLHNYGVISVWYSNDGGINWVSKEGNFPDIPVRDILQNPLDRNEVILATQLGVWGTKNFNDDDPIWNQYQNGMSDVSVTSFDYWAVNENDNNNRIIASTYGRGVFTGAFTANDNGTEIISCNGEVSDFPYSEGFESGLGDWSHVEGDDFDWSLNSGPTRSQDTGPQTAFEGETYLYVEASDPNNPSKTTILQSPCFDLSNESSAFFGFNYNMYGNTIGTLQLEASIDNRQDWNILWSLSGDQGTDWFNIVIDISEFAGSSVRLRWVATTGSVVNSWKGDIAIDNITIANSESLVVASTDKTPESIFNTDSEISLSIYPNPVVDGELYVQMDKDLAGYYEIISITGQTVKNGNIRARPIEVQDLSEGVYILKTTLENDQQLIKQFIKK